MPHKISAKISLAMACALSWSLNVTSLHFYQWPQRQFPSTSPISLRLSPPPRHHQVTLVARAKFEKFDGSDVATSNTNSGYQAGLIQEVEESEDDSCLPSDLVGAIRQSGEASALFANSGGMLAIVELLIPELQFLNEVGAQADVWELSRVFLDTLMEESGGSQKVKAIFPDAGVAALLKYQWTDAKFGCARYNLPLSMIKLPPPHKNLVPNFPLDLFNFLKLAVRTHLCCTILVLVK